MTHLRGYAFVLPLVLLLLAVLPSAARAATAPEDPWWPYQWSLEDAGNSPAQSVFGAAAVDDADIDAQAAWDDPSSGNGAGITVAVVDTRVDVANPDLRDHISGVTAPDNFVTGGCASTTPPNHGTEVAGIVGAVRGNKKGIAGVAPDVRILPVRGLDNCGDGRPEWILPALAWAADNAPIVVASFATDPRMDAAQKSDVAGKFDDLFREHPKTLFVVAAGNEGNDNDALPVYPCTSDEPNVVCVGMSTMDDSPSCASNVGAHSVDLFAPGDRVYSTVWSSPGEIAHVEQVSGTSMAAPLVAGVAALVESSTHPESASDVAQTLRDTVDARDTMREISVAGGRLNAAKALGLLPNDSTLDATQGTDWMSCDADHDGVRDSADHCAGTDAPGPVTSHGCPDGDADGVADADAVAGVTDNCPAEANRTQLDTDRDGIGDACDETPRGPDDDGDGRALVDDRCPTQYAQTADGCPVPVTPTVAPPQPPAVTPPPPAVAPAPIVTPTPIYMPTPPARVVSLSVKARKGTARVAVRLSRSATVSVRVERRVRSHGHWRWRRVTVRTLAGTSRSLTLHRLGKGSYRVSAVVSGTTVRRSFRV